MKGTFITGILLGGLSVLAGQFVRQYCQYAQIARPALQESGSLALQSVGLALSESTATCEQVGIIAYTPQTIKRANLVSPCARNCQVGYASWYSRESCRKEGTSGITASGIPLDDNALTCASWDYAYGTLLKVTCPSTGKSVVCVVNDRGPNRKLYKRGVIIDLSRRAFETIAPLETGLIQVEVRQ